MTWTPFGRVGVNLDQIPHTEIGQAPTSAVQPKGEAFARKLDRELGDSRAPDDAPSVTPGVRESGQTQPVTQQGGDEAGGDEAETDANSDAALASEDLWLDEDVAETSVVVREAAPPENTPRESGTEAPRAAPRTPRTQQDLMAHAQAAASVLRSPQGSSHTSARVASDGLRIDASQGATKRPASGTLERRPQSAAPPPSSRARHADVRSAEISQTQRDSIIRRVALALSEGGGEMRVQLQPHELGHVAMRLKLEGRSLRLELRAERHEVSEVLGRDLDSLRHALQEQGLDVEHFDVRQDARASRDFERDPDEPTSADDERAPGTQRANETSPSARVRAWRNGSGIDFVA